MSLSRHIGEQGEIVLWRREHETERDTLQQTQSLLTVGMQKDKKYFGDESLRLVVLGVSGKHAQSPRQLARVLL
jgi:hypothetical protein